MKIKNLPENTLERLIIYLKVIEELEEKSVEHISSEELAKKCGVHPAQLRKDFNFIGNLGIKGVGYNLKALRYNLKKFLGRSQEWNMVLGGVTPLGELLLKNKELAKEGFYFIAAFDTDEEKIAQVFDGILVYPLTQAEYVFKSINVDIGIITATKNPQRYLKTFLKYGVKAILNLSNTPLFVKDEDVKIENFSFPFILTKLSYFLKKDTPE